MNNTSKRSSEFLNPNDIPNMSMCPRAHSSVDFSTLNDISFNKENQEVKFRKKYSEKFMQEKFSFRKVKTNNVLRDGIRYMKKNYSPSPMCAKNYLLSRIPFFRWIVTYNVRECLLKDLIAGLTVGIIHIPQSMAYALMAGVPAINGLYLTFFTVILYVFFGTSRHISTGDALIN
jgi:hypothetical protein